MAVLHYETRHRAAGFLGVKAYNLGPFAVRFIFHELWCYNRRHQRLKVDSAEIFLTGTIHQRLAVGLFRLFVQRFGQTRAPIVVQRFAPRGFQSAAHLKPVGLNGIQGAQHTIKPRQNAQVILGIIQFIRVQAGRFQPLIGVTSKGKGSGAHNIGGRIFLERGETVAVQLGQFLAQVHQ